MLSDIQILEQSNHIAAQAALSRYMRGCTAKTLLLSMDVSEPPRVVCRSQIPSMQSVIRLLGTITSACKHCPPLKGRHALLTRESA